MRMYEALDLVFRHQETYLNSGDEGAPLQRRRRQACDVRQLVDSTHSGASLTEGEARTLTEAIKGHAKNLYLLMLEAHTGRAWIALGYRTWEGYVRAEFGLSRSRSYELLIQARVVQTIRGAAGMSGVPDISTHLAMRLQTHLPELIESIRAAVTKGWTEEKASDVVAAAVRRQRLALRPSSHRPPYSSETETPIGPAFRVVPEQTKDNRAMDSARLVDIVEFLASLPPAEKLLATMRPDDFNQLAHLDEAARWLTEFAQLWARKNPGHRQGPVVTTLLPADQILTVTAFTAKS
jgi:hypothetical protein